MGLVFGRAWSSCLHLPPDFRESEPYSSRGPPSGALNVSSPNRVFGTERFANVPTNTLGCDSFGDGLLNIICVAWYGQENYKIILGPRVPIYLKPIIAPAFLKRCGYHVASRSAYGPCYPEESVDRPRQVLGRRNKHGRSTNNMFGTAFSGLGGHGDLL